MTVTQVSGGPLCENGSEMPPQASFNCRTVDARDVTLYRDRYDNHILQEHPELARDYDDPASQIEHALLNAVKVTPGQGHGFTWAHLCKRTRQPVRSRCAWSSGRKAGEPAGGWLPRMRCRF
jgi:hypothetical protein